MTAGALEGRGVVHRAALGCLLATLVPVGDPESTMLAAAADLTADPGSSSDPGPAAQHPGRSRALDHPMALPGQIVLDARTYQAHCRVARRMLAALERSP